jgi:hypothetical protein
MRMVPAEEWDLSTLQDVTRRSRLLDPPSPQDLLAAVLREATDAAQRGLVLLTWQEATDSTAPPSLFRLVARSLFP